jgi:hypothetical protein
MLNFIALLLSIIFGGLTLIVDFPNVQLPGFPQVKFVQDDVLNFTGGRYDRVVPGVGKYMELQDANKCY